jgi:hypothetical protein
VLLCLPQIERQVVQGRAAWDTLSDEQRAGVALLGVQLAAAAEKGDAAAAATLGSFSKAETARLHRPRS